MAKKSLAIIGAGVSGLHLAYLLEKQFDVTLIEARARIGGRIFAIDGHDMGPSWIWPHQTRALHLLEVLEIERFAQYTQGDALYETFGGVEHFKAPAAPSFRVKGSLFTLPQRLFERLRDTKIYYNEAVHSVKVLEEKVVLHTNKQSYQSDYIVITTPPRLVQKMSFSPPLPLPLQEKLSQTQTWMGNSAKCVVVFKRAFWRERGLSGFVFSHLGPLAEIHDASTQQSAALFGFVNLKADMEMLKEDVITQMVRLFSIERSEIVAIHIVDWKKEIYSATPEDGMPRSGHPNYGIDMSSYSPRVYFSATEFSYEEGGYIEGAIAQSQKVAKELLSL